MCEAPVGVSEEIFGGNNQFYGGGNYQRGDPSN